MSETNHIPAKQYPLQDQKPLKFNWDKELKETPILYKILMPVAKVVLSVPFASVTVYGKENMPDNGPFVLASNHVKGIDPITVVYASGGKRTLYFMAKEEFFHTPYIRPALTFFHGFPVNRDIIDRKSLQFADRVLKEGFGMMIFPEGTRNKEHTRPRVEDAKAGQAMIIREAEVPVLPVSIHVIDKTDGSKPDVIVRFGELIPYEELGFTPEKKKSKELKVVSNLIMEKIGELWDKDA